MTVAVTFTDVATVPALTTVCTSPWLSLIALVEVSWMPPTDVFNEKATFAPWTEPFEASLTRKTTVELSGRSTSPVPWSAIFVGVADTNSIEPTRGRARRSRPRSPTTLASRRSSSR